MEAAFLKSFIPRNGYTVLLIDFLKFLIRRGHLVFFSDQTIFYLLHCPIEGVLHFAPSFHVTPLRFDPVRIVPDKSALFMLASLKFDPLKFVLFSFAPLKFAPLKFDSLKFAPLKFDSLRFALLKFDWLKFAPFRSILLKFAPLRLHAEHVFVLFSCLICALLAACAPVMAKVRNIKTKTTNTNILLSVFMEPPFR